ncbi:MAG TPA: TetR/AcrR family transcriptional regulator [Myxococcales bacterium]
MSGNPDDPRLERTRAALAEALHQLLARMPFEDITVQKILDRAGVGRSTFYAHYSDKGDLLLSDADRFFAAIAARPVRELFVHVSEAPRLYDALRGNDDVRALGRAHFAARLGDGPVGEALAAALFALLDYWIRTGMREPPEQMEAMFGGLSGTLRP